MDYTGLSSCVGRLDPKWNDNENEEGAMSPDKKIWSR